jgi:hypothetical protein
LSRSSARRPSSGHRPTALATAFLLVAASLAALGLSGPASAATTFTPSEPGATASDPRVVRDASVVVGVDQGARSYRRASTSSSSLFTARNAADVTNGALAVSLGLGILNTACLGALTPKDEITVTGPGADPTVVSSSTSPIRDLADNSAPKLEPKSPQPAASAITYQGDVTDADAYHGVKATVNLTGKPAGTYTVETKTYNMVKTGLSACVVGTPTPAGNGFNPGPVTSTTTFEYRPWQVNFRDVLGKGAVSANITPREFTFSIGTKRSPIFQGTSHTQSFYSLGGSFLLPSDPEACAELITNCLPSGAVECDPAAGCVPRIMVINQRGATGMIGFFDLQTKAFVAGAQIDGTKRLLMSLGTDLDTYYRDTLQQLSDGAAAQGLDLMALLSTEVIARNGSQQLSLSLLNGLQIDPSDAHGGVHLSSSATVQAGVLLDVYSKIDPTSCVANSASNTSATDRYQRNLSHGYTVTKTDLLPEVPPVGPLAAIVGGPVYHIQGTFQDGALANIASAVIGVDTATDEPNGYPVWIEPFISSPTHVGTPRTMDFVGTATWSASESPILTSCLVVDFMLGTGVAVFNNPLPVGLGTLIDAIGQPSPAAQKLSDAVNTAITTVVDLVGSAPVIDSVLGTLLDGLELPSLP